ncbi:putative DNA (cytosine-5)-methyltransferase CMT1 [Trifolium repens]|nr:putative DNA (cytosine-5)-methyltransferase CMT1 [Trifolium repens]
MVLLSLMQAGASQSSPSTPTPRQSSYHSRECELQRFPDCYQFRGSLKERYIQVGNAIVVPVARALGHTLELAIQGLSDNKPLTTLPFKYPSPSTPTPRQSSYHSRECELQGFPDCYQLRGFVKERYIQVGNAVVLPVALALRHILGLPIQGFYIQVGNAVVVPVALALGHTLGLPIQGL